MSLFKTSLLAALAAAILTGGLLYYLNQHRAKETAALRRENNRLRAQLVRKPPARIAANASSAGPVTSLPAVVEPAAFAKPGLPVENYRNEGRATASAAVQTFAWACDRADTGMVSQMITFDPAARQMAEQILARLTEKERAQWKSVDEMAANVLTLSIVSHPFPNADVLAAATLEPAGDDRVLLRLPGTVKDRTAFQKTADGWKYVITEALVRAYVRDNPAPR